MKINFQNRINFGWSMPTHVAITEDALQDNTALSKVEKRWMAQCSKLPDLIKEERQDFLAPHFYDALNEDPCFGTVNDEINNALSRFLMHNKKAMDAAKEGNRDLFLRETGYAAHYLQDGATPPHTEHGNYAHKFFRIPMHRLFERGKHIGTNDRLDILKKNYKYEKLPFAMLAQTFHDIQRKSQIEELPLNILAGFFHNNALFSVQTENQVRYNNFSKWKGIQQRCFDRSVNSTKAYFEYIMRYIPKAKI